MESYCERQEDEVQFLQCVFMGDFEDLRNQDPWKIKRPPEIEIFLTPQKSMSTSISHKQRIQVSIKLRAKYTTDYPDTPPELQLLEPHCLSADLVSKLLKEINQLAKEKLGEVMILEIVQHIQEFLHKHDLPPISLHEEMIKRKQLEAEMEKQRIKQERLKFEEQQLKMEKELLHRKSLTSSESSGSDEELADTVHSSKLSQVKVDNRKKINVLRGKLLGFSSSGQYSVYSGIDCEEGDILVIYEWKIPCKNATTRTKRMKQITSIRQEFEHFLDNNHDHVNLVRYLEMRYQVDESHIIVEVVCENVRGGNMKELLLSIDTGSITGQTLKHYSRQLLQALDYLHTRGIVHNDLKPSLVMIDSVRGILKLCGFTIIKRLSDLVCTRNEEGISWPTGFKDSRGGKKQDILKLGMIIACIITGDPNISYPPVLPSNVPEQVNDFINKCLDDKKYMSYDLLSHPFVTPPPQSDQLLKSEETLESRFAAMQPPQVLPINNGLYCIESSNRVTECVVGSPDTTSTTSSYRSRLGTDFDEMEILGKGGFGDVVKVKNRLDGRFYAIKKIKLSGGSKMMNKLTREVELLSQMNHDNIVRYYNAWIESFPAPVNYTSEDTDDSTFDSTSSSSDIEETEDSEEDDSEGEMDDSLFIDFHQSEQSSRQQNQCYSDEFTDLSLDGSLIGAQQLEANLMDLSPDRLRRKMIGNESSEAIVFEDSSKTLSSSSPTHEDDKKKQKSWKEPGHIQYLYIQMEYCPNQTVRQLIDSGQLTNESDLEWQLFREIVEGLAHIHSHGMIHRDLKPGNIFLNSSRHIKIGDFGLAISFNKHPAISRNNSISNPSSVLGGDTGVVGTALYLAPELLNTKSVLKYSPKVDIYSLGIIFFEMCHPPVSTLMERAKILTDIRKTEIKFPDTFSQDKMSKQQDVIKWLLSHSPQERPTSKELLQSRLIPYKIIDEELQEIFTRTLQNPNSSRYRRLIEELFSQQNSKLLEHTFFSDPKGQDNKKGFDKVKSTYSYTYSLLKDYVKSVAVNVFNKHCALNVQTPLLGPSYEYFDTPLTTKVMDNTGRVLSLPTNHWVSVARYVFHQNITSMKRYDLNKVFMTPKRIGTHPKEVYEYYFDVITSSSANLLSATETIAVVIEIISDLSLIQNGAQFILWLNHTSLTTAILNYCSISPEKHTVVMHFLHKIWTNQMKINDLEKVLKDKDVRLSPLALKTLLKFIDSDIPISELDHSLLMLVRCRSSVSSPVKEAIREIKELNDQLSTISIKVSVNPGLILQPEYFQGLLYRIVHQDFKKKKKQLSVLADGGQYNKIVDKLRNSSKGVREPSFGREHSSASPISIFGISIQEETVMSVVCGLFVKNQSLFPVSKCQALICWLGRDNLYSECKELVKELRDRGLSLDLLYDAALTTLEDIQEYCRRRFIPHVILVERTLWIKQQVTIRTLESGRANIATEKVIAISDLPEYIQVKFGTEKNDSVELSPVVGAGSKSSLNPGSDVSSSLPSVSIITVGRQKLQGNVRRRMDSQTVTKLLPLLRTFSQKYPIEIVVVDFEFNPLCLLAAELNKIIGSNKTDLSNVIKILAESDSSLGRKYVTKVCESIQEKISDKTPIIILYSYVIEQFQIIVNNSVLTSNISS